ncbi:MAG: tungstate ABC transporter substrate-binding protein WtpA [Desulfobacteraceae bacterium]|nr:tungstate ABC transporter substrate-binding protein WtpA [Desulfobacteraceae bacterium]
MKMIKPLRSIALASAVLFLSTALAFAAPKGKVIVFHAGSLSVPFAKIEKDFEALHPGIDILREAGGSTKMARLISEVGKRADIMASADYKVIDNNLVPNFADWNIRFATNQLVLCYTDQSRFSDTVTSDNWHEILTKKRVVWGHSDPNLDPCGYRSIMVLQLAEKFYNIDGLYQKLIDNRPMKNVRPKSVELVNLLKTGNMDYAWEYLSVAVQHGLKYVTLNDHINLGNYKYDAFYKQAKVEVTGKKPGTFKTKSGKSCTYGITMIKNSPNPEGAELFMDYLLSADGGLKILRSMGQPPFVPCRVSSDEMKAALPASLGKLVEVKN